MVRKLLIASGNKGKVKEIKKYLSDFDFDIIGMEEYPSLPEVVEDGSTFKENALKKAKDRARRTGLLTLADDSGLVVNALNGEPGVYSARYAGADATDDENNTKLVREIKKIPLKNRQAHFECVMALVDPEDGELVVRGSVEGLIITEPRGENGFGYDPLFFITGLDKTMAELPLEKKNQISHRASALKKLKKEINDLPAY
ncbi:MAG: XTP/dITP diphosphatase [Halothermotrichaceae bacterium]